MLTTFKGSHPLYDIQDKADGSIANADGVHRNDSLCLMDSIDKKRSLTFR